MATASAPPTVAASAPPTTVAASAPPTVVPRLLAVGEFEDPPSIRVSEQRFFVFSCVGPWGCAQRAKQTFVKFRGAFDTREDADRHCKLVNGVDPDFDVFIVSGYQWVPIPPPPRDEIYGRLQCALPTISEIMQGHNTRRIEAAAALKERKETAETENRAKMAAYHAERARLTREQLPESLVIDRTKNPRGTVPLM